MDITDHFSVINSFDYNIESKKVVSKKRSFTHRNNLKFSRLLTSINAENIDNDMNQTFNYYFECVYSAYNESYPAIHKLLNASRCSPWITESIRSCIKKKSKLYRMFTRGFIVKADYNFYKNRLAILLSKAERLYHFKRFYNEKKCSSKTWSHINMILGNGNKKTNDLS